MAIAGLSAGDVILCENQWDYGDPNTAYTDFIPIEWWTDVYPNTQSYNGVYAAIENAITNGIHVVECGGNGGAPGTDIGYNTDNLTWYGNSGAIIVGAGGIKTAGQYPEGDLEKLNFSSYGSRFDLQGWGEEVVTTGYGHLWNADGPNYTYTDSFAGISSAAPIVAGAVACCVGYWKNYVSPALPSPEYIRNLLVSTGTPKVNPGTGHIGPRPDLQAAITAMYQAYTWVYATSSPLDGCGYGVAWGDYDNDGDQDLYVTTYNFGSFLYRNDGGGVFTSPFGSTTPPNDNFDGTGVAWGDYDNDGDLDLYLAQGNSQANKLFQNNGDGTFADATSGPLGDAGTTYGIAWGDYDKDGDIDLYIANFGSANKQFRNDGGGSFVDATGGTPLGDAGDGCGVAWGDYDNDGDLDLYLVNGSNQANKLFRNDGGGSFTDVTTAPLNDALFGMGAAWGDYDNDGDIDLYLVNGNSGANKPFRNNGGGSFTDVASGPLGDASSGYSCAWGDYDNDGDLDLYLTNGGSPSNNKLFRNDGGGTFTDATSPILADASTGVGVAFGDYDSDGDIDLYVAHGYPNQNKLFQNEIGTANHWLHVNMLGTTCNVSAIGTRVRIVAGGVSQIREVSGGSGFCSQNSLTVEFGLGINLLVDTLEIKWPSAKSVDTYTNLPADTLLTLYEGGFTRGDANGDGEVTVDDVVFLINYLYRNGDPPNPFLAGDATGDGDVEIGDVVYLIRYLFRSGPAPCAGKGNGFSIESGKLSNTLGQAEIRMLLKTDQIPVEFAKASPGGFDELSQLSVVGKFDRDVAGIQLEIEFDPDEVTLLEPSLTSLTNSLQLFSGTKDGRQRIGIVDLSGMNFVPAGEGILVNLKVKGKDLSSIRIKEAILVDKDAVAFIMEISGDLKLQEAEGSENKSQHFSLSQNYPNPFNPQTSIRYALPQEARVKLTIYNVLGQKVTILVDEHQSARYKTAWWDGKDEKGGQVSSGIYFYRLEAGAFSEAKKMLLMK